jgi:carbamoyl-phosphate synthase large subunit
VVPIATALVELGFTLVATSGTAQSLARAGLPVGRVRKVTEEGGDVSVIDLLRRGRCDLVLNTPQGSGARTDGYIIREAALRARIPCITTMPGAAAALDAIARARGERVLSLQERIDVAAQPA